jgi:type II secretory pathway pseudopilin PulG
MKTEMCASQRNDSGAFTLIEVLMAVFACAMILTSIYAVLSQALRARDNATARIHDVRLRARAATVLRHDLQNAIVSGGVLAATLVGSPDASRSRFPGSLRFTTTTGRDSADELFGDVQEVEYYIANDPKGATLDTGMLVRSVDRNLLATLRAPTREEMILSNVAAMEVEFYDGQNWVDSWEVTDGDSELPLAVRVRIRQRLAGEKEKELAPVEILVPWTTQRFTTSGSSSSGTGM